MSLLYSFFAFFFVINIIVFVHEYGHYIAAIKTGVAVKKFSLGMGPEVCGITDKRGTRWCLSAFPVGGYVMMLGDGDIASTTEDLEEHNSLSEEDKAKSFITQTNWKKMLVAFGGPFFNYLYSFLMIVCVAVSAGAPIVHPIIGKVVDQSPAQKSGIMSGDKVISVNGIAVKKYREILIAISESEQENVVFDIQRGDKNVQISLTPEIREKKRLLSTKKTKFIGIGAVEPVFIKKGFGEAIVYAFRECVDFTKEMVRMISHLFSGKQSIDDFGGIVYMASIAGDLLKSGQFALLLMFSVSISLNLGFLNLFPLPVLDGGRILISFLEQISGRKVHEKLLEYIMGICAIFLIGLMLLTIINDVLRIEAVAKFLSGVFG